MAEATFQMDCPKCKTRAAPTETIEPRESICPSCAYAYSRHEVDDARKMSQPRLCLSCGQRGVPQHSIDPKGYFCTHCGRDMPTDDEVAMGTMTGSIAARNPVMAPFVLLASLPKMFVWIGSLFRRDKDRSSKT